MTTTKALFLLIIVLLFSSSLLQAKEKQNKILSSSISLTNLSNNEELCVGKTVTIEWDGVDAAEEVIIEYSTNGGSNWIEITATATGLSYDWTVPNTPSENVLVRVKAVANTMCEIEIGTQIWSCKNLDVTTYRNGDLIPQVTDATEWANLTTGAWCYYNNDAGNNATYGKLYNWYAVNDPRGLAPAGWHVATDAEWTTLTTYLGTDAGSKLGGRADLWTDGALESNANFGNSGFLGLPGGYRDGNGPFYGIGSFVDWWTSSEYDATHAWDRYMGSSESNIYRGGNSKRYGFSVRCVRD